jgi:hypothetical protein
MQRSQSGLFISFGPIFSGHIKFFVHLRVLCGLCERLLSYQQKRCQSLFLKRRRGWQGERFHLKILKKCINSKELVETDFVDQI